MLTFAERLHHVTTDQPALEELATLIAGELRLGWVELTAGDLPPARIGVADGPLHDFTLRRAGRDVGEMHACARRGETLGASDVRTLGEVANFVAVAVDAIRTSDELRISRAELDRAHRDERRRVRRDLHDGLGPTLASIRLRLARRHDATIDAAALDDIFDQVTDAIREVRRIVDGLQPSILEDLGLVPALQILISDVRDTTGLDITFQTSDSALECSTDVATAVYRSVSEALTNVARHSSATTCTVRLEVTADNVDVDVIDNGRGLEPPVAPGMGLRSMHDRTTALGGTVDFDSRPGDGTRVAIRLPT
jgi:signal transduction histidine kinase